ncbi:hypothetical protein GPX89_02740 [Nocardia sp. ET3-3]|uniref:Uncharacterized protein n=1 Tax=Nocardia terrae TaxID=2675851 RepID=A0A7K1UP91_9NOCA|nr:hypothetical protein [Nocardia terrae]MVU76155.1 hypothetical protein [Nocardia terrae]
MRRSDPTVRRAHAARVPVFSIALLVSACTIAGVPRPAPPQLGGLDLGGYSGRPLAAASDTGETYSALLESARMSDAVVSPRAIDPALRTISAVPVPTPAAAVGILADVNADTLARYGMLAGFSIGGTDAESEPPVIGASRSVRLTVLRVRDNTAAIDAARQIDAADFAVNRDNVEVPFPEYFATYGHWRPYVPTMAATLAHGPFVVTLFVTAATTDHDALRSLVTAAFDAELPRLDAFTPTPADQVPALPLDPTGLLSRVLPSDPGKWPYPELFVNDGGRIAGWGGKRSATGVVYGPVEAAVALDLAESTPEAMAVGDSGRLLRFSDAVAAHRALSRFTAVNRSEASPPSGVPDADCQQDRVEESQGGQRAVVCEVQYGRYLAFVYGPDQSAAHRRAAAQYAVLVDAG